MRSIVLLPGMILVSAIVTTPGFSARHHKLSAPSVTPTPQPSVSPSATPVPSATATPQPAATFPIPTDRDGIVKLQILLDNSSFGPGEINGRWSQLSKNALQEYQAANSQPANGQIDERLHRDLEQLAPYANYQIKDEDLQWVGKSPTQPAAQARLKKMLYPSLADLVAERFHTNRDFLRALNPHLTLAKLRPGDTVKVPNVTPFEIESIKPTEDSPPRTELSGRVIKIDTKKKSLDLVDGGKVIASFPITPGSQQLPAPVGTWKIVKISLFPFFRWDKAMLLHGKRSGDYYNVPPGPRNEVGITWIGLNKKGIGIHGTNNPDTIGRTASHGCIRLANWDAVRLAGEVTQGMTVDIF
ncbi:MAG: L,D-transpeptidase family protein [Verrucomicrobia bacterium]|nr:L,D-transpeptidase family protein [Verrucomicrobiota bacterium]